jgi:hypothetical protein
MYRGDEKIAVANDRDLGDAPITFDERAIDRAARDRRGVSSRSTRGSALTTPSARRRRRAPPVLRGL